MLLTVLALSVVAAPDVEAFDVSSFRANLRVYSDGHGHTIALWPTDPETRAFYGNGHTFYAFDVFSKSSHDNAFELLFRDPRYHATFNDSAVTTEDSETLTVNCGKRHTTLRALDAAAQQAMIAKAEFKRSPWNTAAYALARDDKGTYYYVDRGRYDDNAKVFRVFVGQRGNMREEKLKNIVHDSGGDIFATPDGSLRLIVGDTPQTEWVNNDQHIKLMSLEVRANATMIRNDLGIYQHVRYGTPCDDL